MRLHWRLGGHGLSSNDLSTCLNVSTVKSLISVGLNVFKLSMCLICFGELGSLNKYRGIRLAHCMQMGWDTIQSVLMAISYWQSTVPKNYLKYPQDLKNSCVWCVVKEQKVLDTLPWLLQTGFPSWHKYRTSARIQFIHLCHKYVYTTQRCNLMGRKKMWIPSPDWGILYVLNCYPTRLSNLKWFPAGAWG